MRARFLGLLLLPAALLLLPPAPAMADAEWTRYRREVLPDLDTRRAKANQRADDARAFFAGDRPLDDAFPQLLGIPLDEPGSIEGRLRLLEAEAEIRALERTAAIPDLGTGARTERTRTARERALDAEEAADGLERRLLLSYRAVLREHPELGADAVRDALAPLHRDLDRLRGEWREAGATLRGPLEAEIGRIEADAAKYETLIRDLRWTLLAGGDGSKTVEAGLAEWMVDVDLVRAQEELRLAAAEVAAARARIEGFHAGDDDDSAAPVELLTTEEIAGLQAALTERQAALEAAGQALADADEGPAGTVDGARFEALLLRRRAAAKRVEAADVLLMASEEHHTAAVAAREEARKAREAEQRALEEAAAAKKAAQTAVGRQKAAHQLSLAELQSRARDAWVVTEAADNELVGLRQQRDEQLDGLRMQVNDLLPLDGEQRRSEAVVTHRELRRFITTLRAAAIEAEGRLDAILETEALALYELQGTAPVIDAAAEFAADLPAEDAAALEEAIGTARSAGDAEQKALRARVSAARAYVEATLGELEDAKRLQLVIRDFVPRSVLAEDRAYLLRDLRLELELAGPNLVNSVRRRLSTLVDSGGQGLFSRIVQVALGAFWMVFAAVAWWVLRRRARGVTEALLSVLAERISPLYRRALTAITDEVAPTVRASIDLIAAVGLASALRESIPELALLLFVGAQFSLYRVLVGGFELAIVKRPSIRPALFSLPGDGHDLAVSAARVLAFWWVLRGFVRFVTVQLLRTDALRQVLVILLDTGLVIAVLVLLHRLEPISRATLTRRGGADSRWLRPLIGEPKGRNLLLGWLRGLAGGVVLSTAATAQFIQNLGSEGSILGRALNRLNRYRLSREGGTTVEVLRPVPPEVAARVLANQCGDDHRVARPGLDAQLQDALVGWEVERTRGIAALTGNRGDGERTWLDSAEERLRGEGRRVVRFDLERRLTDPVEVCETLSEALGVEPCRDVATLTEALLELPESVFMLEEAQWAFLRTVKGLSGLRAMLDVMSRTSRRHFWIVALHKPAWQYLSRLGSLLKFDMFRTVMEVPPMGEAQLRELIESRIRGAGWSLDFAGLASSTPLAGDPRLETERARTAYFRLLAESSEGNPAAALRQFLGCVQTADAEGKVLRVRVAESLEVAQVTNVDNHDLFTLAAIRIHKRLTAEELARVNNMSSGLVRASLQHLGAMGVVTENGRVEITAGWVPGVARTLRRRHFLHWSE